MPGRAGTGREGQTARRGRARAREEEGGCAAATKEEEKEQTPGGPSSKAPAPPKAGKPKKVDQLPDFLAGLDSEPEAEEEEQEEEEEELSPEDQALNDFLKGLS